MPGMGYTRGRTVPEVRQLRHGLSGMHATMLADWEAHKEAFGANPSALALSPASAERHCDTVLMRSLAVISGSKTRSLKRPGHPVAR